MVTGTQTKKNQQDTACVDDMDHGGIDYMYPFGGSLLVHYHNSVSSSSQQLQMLPKILTLIIITSWYIKSSL